MNRILILPILACMLLGCDSSNDRISQELADQVAAPSKTIDFRLLKAPEWERICVVGPYANNEMIERQLGFKWDGLGKTSIGSNDGIHLITFIRANEVVAYIEHPRSQGDFVELMPRCFSKEKAVLRKVGDKSGWVQLKSKEEQ